MDSITESELLEVSKLEWSPKSFKVPEFLRKFSLPQIVKVVEGFYGDDEDSSLGADQVLSLHCIKSTDKVYGRDFRGKEVNIPLDCQNKVEVRPADLKDVYESVEELSTAFPRYVRISQGYYSPVNDEEVLNVGDKLYLKSIEKNKKGQEKLICINQNNQTIELPQDCVAGFQPLADGKEYYLPAVLTQFSLPVYVQFVDPPTVMGKQGRSADSSFFNSSLGAIYLESSYTENIIIASTISQDGLRTVVTFPRDIDIRLAVCEGMLKQTQAYSEICKTLNKGMDLHNFKLIDTISAFKPRNSVREYPYKEVINASSLQKQEISGYSEVMKLNPDPRLQESDATSSKLAPEVETSSSDVDQLPDCKNTELLLEDNEGSLERKSGSISSTKRPPPKPQRSGNSFQRNRQDLCKSAEQPDLKVNSSSISSQSDEGDVPRVAVTSDNENVSKRLDVSHYSVKQVSEILKELGMDRYIVKFKSEMIDGEMLMCLDDDILMTDFGMNKLHCMKLKKYLEGWRPRV